MTETSQERTMDYVIAFMLGFMTIILSLGGAVLLSVGPSPVDRITGAAWAWSVGYATSHWWVPRIKQAL